MAGIKYDHLHLRSSDVGRVVAFYTDQFSAEVLNHHPDGRVDIVLGGQKIFISPGANSASDSKCDSWPFAHFALSVTDLRAMIDRLKESGVVVVQDFRVVRPGIYASFVEGPDKAVIELIQRD